MFFTNINNHKKNLWLKIGTLIIAFTTLLPSFLWAFESSIYLSPNSLRINNQQIDIPNHNGKIFASFQGEGDGPFVIHIQDLHCNFEVQNNIASIIDAVASAQGKTLVGVEGASLPINVRKLSAFPDEQVKRDVGLALMHAGKISGAEFYAATGRHAIDLVGIEKPEAYQLGRNYANALLNQENQGELEDLRESLDELKTGIYSPELSFLDESKKHFRNNEIALLKYAAFLKQQAISQALAWEQYPQMRAYLSANDSTRDAVNAEQLYAELEQVDRELRKSLYNSPAQSQLDELIRRVDTMERLLNVSASPEEVAAFRKAPLQFKIKNFEAFFNQNTKAETEFDAEIFNLDAALEVSKAFYDNADRRSREFIENFSSRLQNGKSQVAILITGGYHTEQILEQLKMKNFSYIAVKPDISHQDLANPYFSLLRNQSSPLERLLAQNQKVIALTPFFLEWSDANAEVAEGELSENLRGRYQALEATLEVGLIRRLIRSGAGNSALLAQRYKTVLSKYPHNFSPDWQRILTRGSEILIPFKQRLLTWVSPRSSIDFAEAKPLQTTQLDHDTVAFFELAREQEVSRRFQDEGHWKFADLSARGQWWGRLALVGSIVAKSVAGIADLRALTSWLSREVNIGAHFKIAGFLSPLGLALRRLAGRIPGRLNRPQAANQAAAGAIGKIKVESVQWQGENAVLLVRNLDRNGQALGEASEIKLQLRPFHLAEKISWAETVAEWEKIYSTKSDWYGNDRQIFGEIILHSQELVQRVADDADAQSAQGLYVISGSEVLRGPPVEVLAGLGLPNAIFLKVELLQQAFSAAALHEVGESLDNPLVDHVFLRGAGKRERSVKAQLSPEDIGFVGRILGAQAQENLTQTLQALKTVEGTNQDTQAADPVWETIRQESRQLISSKNTLNVLPGQVLKQKSLEAALAEILAADLASPLLAAEPLKKAVLEALQVPETRASLRRDLTAVKARDAAAHTLAEPFFHFKGFQALQAYRVAHWLFLQGRRHDALTLQSRISKIYGVDIHPAAKIGSGVVLDHGTGIVIGETAEVGDDVTFLHHVTLGGTGKESGDRHPKVGNGVFFGAGASILGNIKIGEGSRIAAGSVVLKEVPPYSTVAGTPARIVRRGVSPETSKRAAGEWFRGVAAALRRYSNVHRGKGQNSQISTELFEKAREIVLDYLQLDPKAYTVVFANPLRIKQLTSQLSEWDYHTLKSQDFGLALGINAIAIKTPAYAKLGPIQPGGGTVQLVSEDFVIWAEGPDTQEGGTPDIAGIIALAKGIRIAQAAGIGALEEKEPALPVEAVFADSLQDEAGKPLTGEALEKALIPQWVGAREKVPTAQGNQDYIQFDNGASTPAFGPIWDVVARVVRQPQAVLEQVIARTKEIAAGFFHAPQDKFKHIFAANTTEAINIASWNIARLAKDAKEKEGIETVVVNTIIEHNSNELPWRHLPNVSLERLYTDEAGFIDLGALEKLLQAFNVEKSQGNKRIRLVTLSGASNVLGSMNDIAAVSALAHKYGAQILVDGAQLTAHREVNLERDNIDYYAYSGHKMYAPFGSGGLIVKKDVLVLDEKQVKQIEASGESNAAGIAAVGKGLELLQRIGMQRVEEHERSLTQYALEKLNRIPGITVYGAKLGTEQFGNKGSVLAFSVAGVPHNRAAQLLAENWGIGVRNGCFCAHILLKYLLGIQGLSKLAMNLSVKWFPNQARKFLPGLVRASFGLENTKEEIDRFAAALEAITQAKTQEPWRNRILAWLNLSAPSLPQTEIGKTIEHFTEAAVDEVYAWKNRNGQTEESTLQGKQGLSAVAETPEKLQTTQASAHSKTVSESSRANAPPAIREWVRGVVAALRRYSNVHRGKGQNSQISTELFEKAREIVLDYLKLDAKEYTVVFANPLRIKQLTNQLSKRNYRTLSSQDLGLALGINAIAIKTPAYAKLGPIQPGGGTVQLVSEDFVIWAEGPDTQEGGTPDIAGIIALAKGIRIAQAAGIGALEEKEPALPVEAVFADSLQDEAGKPLTGEALEKALIPQWVGAREKVPTAQGNQDYIQFDNGASTPAFGPIWDVVARVVRQPQAVLEQVIARTKEIAAGFFHAPQDKFKHIFAANTTEAINIASWNIARLAKDAKEKEGIETVVVNTIIEHNSNELPWRHLPNVSLERLYTDEAGFIDLGALEKLLQAFNVEKSQGNKRIRLVTLSGASNVLGSMNDIAAVSALAHKYGAQILVDGAQLTAHREVNLERDNIDYYAYSGHKMYAPFGSGGLIVKKDVLVLDEKQVKQIEASGESNAAGIAAVGKGLELLQRIGMQRVEEHERSLTQYALEKLNRIPGITVYGAKLGTEQFGNKGSVLAFSVAGVPHNRAAQLLAENWGIGVRNGCFCAHILLKYLLGIQGLSKLAMNLSVKWFPNQARKFLPGLVRASFGLENTREEIDRFAAALEAITQAKTQEPWRNRILAWLNLSAPSLPQTEIGKTIEHFTAAAVEEVYAWPQGPKYTPGIQGTGLGPQGPKQSGKGAQLGETLEPAQVRQLRAENFASGYAVAEPGNSLLQTWRTPREISMAVLFGVFAGLDWLVKHLGEKRSPLDSQTGLGYLKLAERRYFPLNAIESQRYRKLVRNGFFQEGSLTNQIFGRYRSEGLKVTLLLPAGLLQGTLSRQSGQESGLVNKLSRLRAGAASILIRQIYYYRSSEYYGQSWTARWQNQSTEEFARRRAQYAAGIRALITDENDPGQLRLLGGYLLQRSPQTKAYFIRGKLWNFRQELLKDLMRDGFEFSPKVDLDRLPEKIWEAIKAGPEALRADIERSLALQTKVLKAAKPSAEFAAALPGTLPFKEIEKIRYGMPVIDEVRRIIRRPYLDKQQLLDPALVQQTVELPARRLVEKIRALGLEPAYSNAYGPELKGVIWYPPLTGFETTAYFTPLTTEDYSLEAMAAEPLGIISRGTGGTSSVQNPQLKPVEQPSRTLFQNAPVFKYNGQLFGWRGAQRLGLLILASVFLAADRFARWWSGPIITTADTARSAASLLETLTREYFPLADVQTRAFTSANLQTPGSLGKILFGDYQDQPDGPASLGVYTPWLEAAAMPASQSGSNSWLSLRATLGKALLRQIFLYRSAAYYGMGKIQVSSNENARAFQRRENLAEQRLRDWLRTEAANSDAGHIARALAEYALLVKSLGLKAETIAVAYPPVSGQAEKPVNIVVPSALDYLARFRLALKLDQWQWGLDESGQRLLLHPRIQKSSANSV
jgi:serine O-acetyltransferase